MSNLPWKLEFPRQKALNDQTVLKCEGIILAEPKLLFYFHILWMYLLKAGNEVVVPPMLTGSANEIQDFFHFVIAQFKRIFFFCTEDRWRRSLRNIYLVFVCVRWVKIPIITLVML